MTAVEGTCEKDEGEEGRTDDCGRGCMREG